ncbi:ParB/Srx family N-terminal domain-containing protein [Thalassobius sp. Cn5-15]|uniref:ParB/Srx family N-terminal domain-containing protein n=1 Tax=Thalassobius sp. Cn5-15 TaxID=2917763 RepID=UPI001EF33888|nr:ParB/Srx family N-terminal domain-containing protein [Thalassobius sp. Cn5-15]MCG7493718.1 ParB/Srx family N-terminal domain-containing protein [Thalassobius sp. Cn5-15]
MRFKEIEVDKLVVNPSNDRHGPMGSESAAIAWLFENKARDMKALAQHISQTGRLFDSPLVVKDGDKFLVKDGNRRVTSIKLLIDPNKAPIQYRDFS